MPGGRSDATTASASRSSDGHRHGQDERSSECTIELPSLPASYEQSGHRHDQDHCPDTPHEQSGQLTGRGRRVGMAVRPPPFGGVVGQHGEPEGDQNPALRVADIDEPEREAGDDDPSSVRHDGQP